MTLSSLFRSIFWWLLQVVYWVAWPFRPLYKKAFGYDAFISYSRKDALQYAKKLESKLSLNLICYRDEGDASGGRPLSEIIQNGVLRSRAIIVVITPEACASPWVFDELTAFRAQQVAAVSRGEKPQSHIFPVFLHPCTPETLPGSLIWLKDHLGCKEADTISPSDETIWRIRAAFLGIPKAIKLYGAVTLLMLSIFIAITAIAVARMSEARRYWLGAATRAEAVGRVDDAEFLIAKAAESDVVKHWEDADSYTRVRNRRMLIPAGCFPLKDDSSPLALFATRNGISVLQEATSSGMLEVINLEKNMELALLPTEDRTIRFAFDDRNVLAAVGNQLVSKSIDDQSPPTSLKLPGACLELRLVDTEIRLLCESDGGVWLVVGKSQGSQIRTEQILLKGDRLNSSNMLLMEGEKAAVCSIGDGLRLTARYWSRLGEELPSANWLYADSHIDFPEIVHHDRYIVFNSMRDFPGMDPRKEPEMMAVDLMYPPQIDGGREVQRVAQSASTVKSLNRSKAFAAAIGSGNELRFWDAFNPPLVNQYSVPVTDGMSSFEVWESPPLTPYFGVDAAVVLVAKDKVLEVYAERYEEGARRPAVDLIARYSLGDGFETGRILVSGNGEYVGVLQWKHEGERTVNRIALFRRAGASPEQTTQVPRSEGLIRELSLNRSEIDERYFSVPVKR